SPESLLQFLYDYIMFFNSFIFNVGCDKDPRDSAFAPTRGSFTSVSADFSVLDLKYYMLSAEHQHYLPIGRSMTLALNGMINYGRSYEIGRASCRERVEITEVVVTLKVKREDRTRITQKKCK